MRFQDQAPTSASALRERAFGLAARHSPIAGRGAWALGINADFDGGSKSWEGDVLVPLDRWLLHVRNWPDPFARRRHTRGGPWEDYIPHLDVGRGLIGLAGPEPGHSLVEWLPVGWCGDLEDGADTASSTDWARRAIERIPENIRTRLGRFRFGQWQLLRLVAREPAMFDLIHSNPALAWALASAGAFVDHPPRDIDGAALERVRHRQRDIAGWLGFPATEGSIRLLKKVPPDSCGTVPLLELRKLAADAAAAESLRHLRELPATVILAAGSRILGPSLTPAALRDVIEEIARLKNGDGQRPQPPEAPEPTIAHLLEDAARMAQMLPGANSPRPVNSVRALRRRHNELVAQFLHFAGPPSSQRAFPAPPLPPGDGIQPITKLGQLREEARQQQNCVASFAKRIASGGYYVYRVTQPGRATLGLRRDRQGRWHIDQLAGPRNRKVSMELRAHVLRWFHATARHLLDAAGAVPTLRRGRRSPLSDDPAHPMLPGL